MLVVSLSVIVVLLVVAVGVLSWKVYQAHKLITESLIVSLKLAEAIDIFQKNFHKHQAHYEEFHKDYSSFVQAVALLVSPQQTKEAVNVNKKKLN